MAEAGERPATIEYSEPYFKNEGLYIDNIYIMNIDCRSGKKKY